VCVNALSLGLIRTELSAPLLADDIFMARRMQMTPLRRQARDPGARWMPTPDYDQVVHAIK
jgi:hypothetical protein